MFKKPYVLAIVSILSIPVATVLGGMLFSFINPEIASGHPNYERNYRLLALARMLAIRASWLVNMGLGLLCCYFLVKSKKTIICMDVLGRAWPVWNYDPTTLQDKGYCPGTYTNNLSANSNSICVSRWSFVFSSWYGVLHI